MEQGPGPTEAGGCQAVILVESLESGLDFNERAFTPGGCQGQEPEGVKEYGKSQGSEWPGVAPVGVAVKK